ncbi:MAG TPA: DNA/RNA non-specific endonuclease [Gemmatimonadales bacterium]|jgi:DNA/RNA endonuclease G (NUC1)/PKD repeat protein
MKIHVRSAFALLAAAAFAACSESHLTQPKPTQLLGGTASLNAPPMVISQIYGGGGNSGATYKNDFIEIFNPGASAQSVNGWSVQYASAAGSTWQVTTLTNVSIAAGGYYLIQESQGAGGTTALPTPDAAGTIAMSATAGKVLLVSSTTAQTGTCPTGSSIVDAISFGSTATDCGAGTTPTLSNTTAALRGSGGCTYNNLASDFTTGAPTPRNSASPANSCGVSAPPTVASVTVSPNSTSVSQGAKVTFTAQALDASSQPIAGVVFTWASDNSAAATVSAGVATGVAPGDAHITATAPNNVAGTASLHVTQAVPPGLPDTRFSEIHYDNVGTDANEAIEIEGTAGTDVTGWSIVLYDGNGGKVYNTTTLSGTIPATCAPRGVMVTNYAVNGIQNGSPDGMALVDAGGNVIEFLSYEGTFTAVDGPAAGLVSTDIVASENSAPVGISIQRDAFNNWALLTQTFGACNATGNAPPTGTTVSISINLPRQAPVGFVKPAFATVHDGSGNVITPPLMWTSSDSTITSVDTLGYVTALVPGTVNIRATEPGGAFGETTFDALPATAPTGAQYHNNVMFGVPADGNPADDIMITRPQYSLSYNASRGGPNWVAYNINATTFGASPRCDCFSPDPLLPSSVYHVVDFNYRNGGYDRGHMTNSEIRTDTYQENAQTFYLTNVLPQAADNNQGPWEVFENFLSDQVRLSGKEVWVYSGGVFGASPGTLKSEGHVAIPDYTWKVAVIMNAGQTIADVHTASDLQVIAVMMPNLIAASGGPAGAIANRSTPWQNYQTPVDQIEAQTGYDLLAALPDQIENQVEANDHAPVVVTGGPYSGVEGTAVAFNGAGSSDPDAGDVITWAWDFGDGTSGVGAIPSHTYADNGSYTVTLTVTDKYGASSAATTLATIANANPAITSISLLAIPHQVATPVSATVTFTDAGINDTHQTSFAWGDGSNDVVTGEGSSAASHSYSAAGLYFVTVTVTDKDGGSTTATSTRYAAIYDPSAGFTWADGRFADGAPETAHLVDDVRYTAGLITGYVNFTSGDRTLSFTNGRPGWMVVSGNQVIIHGATSITGRSGTFNFLVVTIDHGGVQDGMRVKITDSNGVVIYDNQPGQPDNSTVTSPAKGYATVRH